MTPINVRIITLNKVILSPHVGTINIDAVEEKATMSIK